MMERCPLCRAALNGADTCRRCRAELGTAQRAEREAEALTGAAMHRLALGDVAGARVLLRHALELRATSEAGTLWDLVAAMPDAATPRVAGAVPPSGESADHAPVLALARHGGTMAHGPEAPGGDDTMETRP